jgi:hypothetical protein
MADPWATVLDAMVRRQYEALGQQLIDYTDPTNLDRLRSAMGDRALADYTRYPASTRYENPSYAVIVRQHADLVERVISSTGEDVPRPKLVLSPTGRISATTVLIPGTSVPAIFYEANLVTFVMLLARAIAQCVPTELLPNDVRSFGFAPDEIDEHMARTSGGLRRYNELVTAFLSSGDASRATPYQPVAPWDWLAGVLRTGMHLFLIAHEYAHLLLGHLESANRTAPTLPGPARTAGTSEITYRGWQELAADTLGLALALQAAEESGISPAFAVAGATAYMKANELMGKAVYAVTEPLELGIDYVGDYPAFSLRRETIAEYVRQTFGAGASNLLVAADGVTHCMDKLHQGIATHLDTLHRQRIKGKSRPAVGSRIWRFYRP